MTPTRDNLVRGYHKNQSEELWIHLLVYGPSASLSQYIHGHHRKVFLRAFNFHTSYKFHENSQSVHPRKWKGSQETFRPMILKPHYTSESLGMLEKSTDAWVTRPPPPPRDGVSVGLGKGPKHFLINLLSWFSCRVGFKSQSNLTTDRILESTSLYSK